MFDEDIRYKIFVIVMRSWTSLNILIQRGRMSELRSQISGTNFVFEHINLHHDIIASESMLRKRKRKMVRNQKGYSSIVADGESE